MNTLLTEIKTGLKKPRTGWIIEPRNIPREIAETVWEHAKKVVKAARIFGRHFPQIDYRKFVRMAIYHDLAEYKEKDYPPGEISKEVKHERERAVIESLRDKFNR